MSHSHRDQKKWLLDQGIVRFDPAANPAPLPADAVTPSEPSEQHDEQPRAIKRKRGETNVDKGHYVCLCCRSDRPNTWSYQQIDKNGWSSVISHLFWDHDSKCAELLNAKNPSLEVTLHVQPTTLAQSSASQSSNPHQINQSSNNEPNNSTNLYRSCSNSI